MIQTKQVIYTPEERKKRIAKMREYHQHYFNSIGQPDVYYVPKMCFGNPPDRVKLFPSEVMYGTSEKTFYTEWVDRQYIPEDNRRLYRYIYNPDYATQYIKDGDMYIVPASNFELVKEGVEEDEFGLINPDEDVPLKDISLRDLVAIIYKMPVSRKEWLNEIIKQKLNV